MSDFEHGAAPPWTPGTTFIREECGCSVDGIGNLKDPWRVKRCPTHDSGPRLLRENSDLLAACEAAAAWLHDPNDATGHFERLAEAFHRDTGFMRPGKDAAAAAHQDPMECEIAWNDWRVAKAAKVLADVRAAIARARGGK